MTTHILDRIDELEREYTFNNKKPATKLILGVNAATFLKEELNISPLKELKQYHGYRVIVDMSDDAMDVDSVEFA